MDPPIKIYRCSIRLAPRALALHSAIRVARLADNLNRGFRYQCGSNTSNFNSDLGSDLLQYGKHLRFLLFGQEVHLQVEVVPLFTSSGIVVLTDENEG